MQEEEGARMQEQHAMQRATNEQWQMNDALLDAAGTWDDVNRFQRLMQNIASAQRRTLLSWRALCNEYISLDVPGAVETVLQCSRRGSTPQSVISMYANEWTARAIMVETAAKRALPMVEGFLHDGLGEYSWSDLRVLMENILLPFNMGEAFWTGVHECAVTNYNQTLRLIKKMERELAPGDAYFLNEGVTHKTIDILFGHYEVSKALFRKVRPLYDLTKLPTRGTYTTIIQAMRKWIETWKMVTMHYNMFNKKWPIERD